MELHVPLVLLLLIGFASSIDDCVVGDFEVQANFDIRKFAGRWYEISWIPFYFEPPFANFFDFVTNYTVHNDTYTYVIANNAGRATMVSDDCIPEEALYVVSDEDPAKWTRNISKSFGEFFVDFWIMTTDYDNYAFTYGCGVAADDGTCERVHAWKWSRRQTLEARYMDVLDRAAETYCLGNATFDVSPQATDCIPTDVQPSGASAPMTSAVLLLCLSIRGLF